MTSIDEAAGILRQGGIIAYPTEGVWGLGCDPGNENAVSRLLVMKARPESKGLILVAGTLDQVEPLLESLEHNQRQVLQESWPGPVTWLVPDVDQLIPDWIKGQFETVALRVSGHPLVAGLCEKFGGMIVSTSANPGDEPPALTQEEVESYFPSGIDMIVPGELGGLSGPSEIRDLASGRVLR